MVPNTHKGTQKRHHWCLSCENRCLFATKAQTGAFLQRHQKKAPKWCLFGALCSHATQAAEVTEGGDYGPADTKVGIKVGPNASSAPSSGPGVAALTHRAQGALCLGACAHMASISSRPTPTYAVYQATRPCKKAPKKGTALCLSCEKVPF